MDLSKLSKEELNTLSKKITIEKRIRNPNYKTNKADKCVAEITSLNYHNYLRIKELDLNLSDSVNNFLDKLSKDDLFNFNIKKLNITVKHDLSEFVFYIFQGGRISLNLCIEIINSIYKNNITTRHLEVLNEAFKYSPRFNLKHNLNNTQDLIDLIKSELEQDLEITLQYNDYKVEYKLK